MSVYELIEEEVQRGTNSVLAADKVIERLRNEDPDALLEFLRQRAPVYLQKEIKRALASTRQRALNDSPKDRFARAIEAAKTGNVVPLQSVALMETWYEVGENMKRLRDMTRQDLLTVADSYQSRAERHGMLAAFYRALGKVVGDNVLGEVLDEDHVRYIYTKVTGQTVIEGPQAPELPATT